MRLVYVPVRALRYSRLDEHTFFTLQASGVTKTALCDNWLCLLCMAKQCGNSKAVLLGRPPPNRNPFSAMPFAQASAGVL